MNESTDHNLAKTIMGSNFIGPEELCKIEAMKLSIPNAVPKITYSRDILEQRAKDYILILGVSHLLHLCVLYGLAGSWH